MNARSAITGLLDLYRRTALSVRKLTGKTESDEAARNIVEGRTWEEFCDTLKAAGAALHYPGAPQDPLSQAEGYRYLSRLLRAGLEGFVEYGDPQFPSLERMVHETVKMGADNPDNYYQNCVIDGKYDYLVSGTRGSVAYLSFASKSGHYGQAGGMLSVGELDASNLLIDDDGFFELKLSAKKKSGNWLQISPDTGLFIVRQTFLDRTVENIASLRIDCLNPDIKTPQPLTPLQLEKGLQSASTLVAGASMLFSRWAHGFQKHSNSLPMFSPEVSLNAGGDPNIIYYHSHWQLEDNEALMIDVSPPPCEHWNFQLNNYWMESLDYRFHRIHINKHLATYNRDGSVTVIVSKSGCDHPNGLVTAGHSFGTMCWRWVKADKSVQPSVSVINVDDIPPMETT